MDTLTLIERYGSFGLVCVLMVALLFGVGAALRFVKDDLFPRFMAYVEAKDREHAAERKADRETMVVALGKLGERLDKIEDHIGKATAK